MDAVGSSETSILTRGAQRNIPEDAILQCVTPLSKQFLWFYVLFSIYLWSWIGTQSTITAAMYWPIVPALDDSGAISGMNYWQGKLKCLGETFPSAALFTTDPT
jgi:hypothetical protein